MEEEYICIGCGEDYLKHWNQGIYECETCGCMFPKEVLEIEYGD